MIENIRWFGHSSFSIEGPPLITIDPWRVSKAVFHPDAILVSHDHYESFSLSDINRLRGTNTRIITSESIATQIDGAEVIRPWQSISVDRASIKAVPAYSTNSAIHPREAGGLGFVVSVNLHDIYFVGGSDVIPEMDIIHPDILIAPIDGQGNLTVEDAAEVVRRLRPRYTIPCNWGSTESVTATDARQLAELVQDYTDVRLLQPLR